MYADRRGQWYFKVSLGKDGLTGRREQITRRGDATASKAANARRELIGKLDAGLVKLRAVALTVNELLDLYLDGLDADQRLSPKTRHDYRVYAQTYVRKPLGNRKVRDVTPELILTWQRTLLAEGGAKDGRPLAPNTIRLARARRLQEPSGSPFRAGSWLSIRSCTRQDRRPGVRSRAIGAPSRPESSSP